MTKNMSICAAWMSENAQMALLTSVVSFLFMLVVDRVKQVINGLLSWEEIP